MKNTPRVRALIRGDWGKFGGCRLGHECTDFCSPPTQDEFMQAKMNPHLYYKWRKEHRDDPSDTRGASLGHRERR